MRIDRDGPARLPIPALTSDLRSKVTPKVKLLEVQYRLNTFFLPKRGHFLKVNVSNVANPSLYSTFYTLSRLMSIEGTKFLPELQRSRTVCVSNHRHVKYDAQS